jgi:hypothetical protein
VSALHTLLTGCSYFIRMLFIHCSYAVHSSNIQLHVVTCCEYTAADALTPPCNLGWLWLVRGVLYTCSCISQTACVDREQRLHRDIQDMFLQEWTAALSILCCQHDASLTQSTATLSACVTITACMCHLAQVHVGRLLLHCVSSGAC